MIFETELLNQEVLYEDCVRYEFQMPSDMALVFDPGQYLMAEVGDVRRRPYTIETVSADHRRFSLLIDLRPDGIGSKYFRSLRPGMKTYFQGPFGLFTLGLTESSSYLFIATGVGIAPFMSMIKRLVEIANPTVNIRLVQGAATQRQLINREYFFDLQSKSNHQNFKWIRSISQEAAGDSYAGRTSQWIKDNYVPVTDELVYLCGAPEMIRDCREVLIQKGIDPKHLKIEVFS